MMLSLLAAKASLATGQETQKAASSAISEDQFREILVAISKLDSKFTIIRAADFSIESGNLTVNVRANRPTLFDGQPYQNGAPQTGLYGQVYVSQKFYGIEIILDYSLLREGVPFGGALVEERVTILYEDTSRFKPVRPRAFASKPFAINKDGTFQDRQVFGRYDVPFPDKTMQILKQELILDSELAATIYIVRTPKEIRVLGYSVPPLLQGFENCK